MWLLKKREQQTNLDPFNISIIHINHNDRILDAGNIFQNQINARGGTALSALGNEEKHKIIPMSECRDIIEW